MEFVFVSIFQPEIPTQPDGFKEKGSNEIWMVNNKCISFCLAVKVISYRLHLTKLCLSWHHSAKPLWAFLLTLMLLKATLTGILNLREDNFSSFLVLIHLFKTLLCIVLFTSFKGNKRINETYGVHLKYSGRLDLATGTALQTFKNNGNPSLCANAMCGIPGCNKLKPLFCLEAIGLIHTDFHTHE